jgi:carboxylate-amine ligase
MSSALPNWARWNAAGAGRAWTVGVEEEVMLLDPSTWQLTSCIDDLLPALPAGLRRFVSAETHGAALEMASSPAATVGGALAELGALRRDLGRALDEVGLRAAVAGTHPTAQWQETEIAGGARREVIHDSMRELARREPTFALHVHVGIPDAEQALQVLVGLRAHLPALIALSANSPFWQGRDSGMAAVRLPVFGAFPRTGIPRRFADYADYVEAVDVLLRCGAFAEPTFLWWDLRLQPALGTLEIRVMDAQSRLEDVGALTALVQCLARLEGTDRPAAAPGRDRPEVLDENRFLASRDGMEARLLDPERRGLRPVRDVVEELVERCRPHAAALGCAAELEAVAGLAREPGYARQRAVAARPAAAQTGGGGLGTVTEALSGAFTGDAVAAGA